MIGIEITNIKLFMNMLLGTKAFDMFLLEEATVVTYNTFTIDGHINQEFYAGIDEIEGEASSYEWSEWSDIRQIVFGLIKGKRTPLQMKIVFHLKPEWINELLLKSDTNLQPGDIRSLVLTLRYDHNGLKLVTATSLNIFSMDKSLDKIWDQYCRQILDQLQIPYELLN